MKKVLEAISNFLEIVCNSILFISMLGMFFVLGANILLRFAFHQPISWANELSRYSYIYIVLLGTAVSYREEGHAKIVFVRDAMSPKIKILFDIIHFAVIIFLSIILIFYGIKHVITMWPVHGAVLTSLSMGIVYLCVPFSSFALLIFAILKFFKIKFRTKEST